MLYIFKEGRFIRRGSPIKPTEAGVYAYTKVRILYRPLFFIPFKMIFVGILESFDLKMDII